MNRLQVAGLVERQPGAGRATVHQLTGQGDALLREGQKIMSHVVRTSFSSLSQHERQELSRLRSKVLDDR